MNFANSVYKVLIFTLLLAPAGMKAMEKPSFIDCNGKEVTLTRAQQEAFEQLQLIKDFKEHCPGKEITFAETKPFLTGQNIVTLLALMDETQNVENILAAKDATALINLFKLADYLGVSEKLLECIAEYVYQPLKDLNNKEESESLIIVEAQLSCLNFLRALQQKASDIGFDGVTKSLNLNFSVLNDECAKKITSTKMINKVPEIMPRAWQTSCLRLAGHKITELNIDKLMQVFPYLNNVYVPSNNIKLLCIDNPSRFKGLVINAKNNPITLTNVMFTENMMQKVLTWLKAFAAQSKVVMVAKDLDAEKWCSILMMETPVCTFSLLGWNVLQKGASGNTVRNFFSYDMPMILIMLPLDLYVIDRLVNLKRDLTQAVQDNPYAVRVETDSGNKEFPSLYSYKLFGKNS